MTAVLRNLAATVLFGIAATLVAPVQPARADSAAEIDAKVDLALTTLLAQSQTAKTISKDALAVLVFPDIVKAGFGIGGQYGEGALRRDGVTVGYYNIAAASFGFQIGAQSYSQAMYFMTEEALRQLDRVKGFEIGAETNIAVINEGASVDVNTSTIRDPIVVFAYGQTGLMAGLTVEGSKITKFNPR